MSQLTKEQFEKALKAVKKDLAALAKRTKEDDEVFTRELLKLKNRIGVLEKQVKKLKLSKQLKDLILVI